MTPDLAPAAETMRRLLTQVTDDQLDLPTPCERYRLGDLVEHVGGLASAFIDAARKAPGAGGAGPSGDAARLPPKWREIYGERLTELGEAWRDPAAWEGRTRAGGVDLAGSEAGAVALDELVLHGWDVARAVGLPYEPDEATLDVVEPFVASFSGPGHEEARNGLFGPEVTPPAGASRFARVLAMAGRDPEWRPDGPRG
ncbi:uncharacterized protein (TIGR03086 family) [Stackebrandtia albiflava]|uniref:Uncharacterized protein (TIGR03086 family) n=1 Tax=Stackebrandtia albiflava TaxID=406432 RepID=A0A562V1T8_9ACTN|nr:TIGR03086 family metal-binding protein [Stackebrandtia albiflava]TWJ11767.1 uncharacterized protein (TIGR03086 family) [Stackebrandtia albiflava]